MLCSLWCPNQNFKSFSKHFSLTSFSVHEEIVAAIEVDERLRRLPKELCYCRILEFDNHSAI